MRYLLALLFPWLVFFTIGKPFQGIICLCLQMTLIGWLPATIWALFSVSDYNKKQETDRLINAINTNKV